MTDSNDKEKAVESDVIESVNETEEATTEVTAADEDSQELELTEAAPAAASSSSLPMTFSAMAIAGVVLLGGGGYWLSNEQQHALLEQQSILQTQIQEQQSLLQSQLQEQRNQLQRQITANTDKSGSDNNDLRTKIEAISTGLAGSERDLVAHREIVEIQKKAFDNQTAAFEKQTAAFEEQQKTFDSENKHLQEGFDSESKRLQQRETELSATLEDVRRSIGRTGSQWMAAEAEYLIRVANHRLRLERDEKTAMSALQAADDRLKATGDPLWTEVREALASEMSALLALVKLDTIGKAAILGSMVKQVDKLRLIDAAAPEIHVKTKTSEVINLESVISKAKELLAQGWAGFKTLVIVRRHDAPVTAMMPPEQRYFIYQNLRMQLEAARFAILRSDTELYTSSLTTVKEWLNEFVVKDEPTAQAMADELEGLLKVNIRPELPDISGSLRLLREKMKVVGMEAPAS